MSTHPLPRGWRRPVLSLLMLAALVSAALMLSSGAGTTPAGEATCRARHVRLEVQLDPASHRLEATAELTLACPSGATAAPQLALHPQLEILELRSGEQALPWRQLEAPPAAAPGAGEAPSVQPARYELPALAPRDGDVLRMRYAGTLYQDVQAGEKQGEIHNFAMHAHVGPEGVYLEPEGYWYPQVESQAAAPQERVLADFELRVRELPGLLLVASGDRQGELARDAAGEAQPVWSTWRSPFPLPGMALVGGAHRAWQQQVGEVMVSVHLGAESASFAAPILAAAARYLELYQPLLGPYPYREFTVVENFFSSGFAFPGFTVLAREVVHMGEHGLRPGYLDHELLHNWWGNGVFVSELDGNWCEALASYCANYMRPVLEGDAEAARKQRRDIAEQLSRLTPEQHKPLDSFGRPQGASRFIGYQKGSMVFAQLAREVGQDVLWRGLARFFREQRGHTAGWRQIRQAVEAESGRDLEPFFRYWVHGHELPQVAVEQASQDPGSDQLQLTVRYQGGDGPPLRLPLRLGFGDEHRAPEVREPELDPHRERQELRLPSAAPARWLEVDPDYLTLRRLPPELLMPDFSAITSERPLNLVRAAGDDAGYEPLAADARERYSKGGELRELDVEQLSPGQPDHQLDHGHALVLGRAARHPHIAGLLAGSPVQLTPAGFRVHGQDYDTARQALLACVRHPRDTGSVVCLYLGNGPEALTRSYLVPFYGGNSLLIFDGGTPVLREDFEQRERIAIRQQR